jgi:hypothetical protein
VKALDDGIWLNVFSNQRSDNIAYNLICVMSVENSIENLMLYEQHVTYFITYRLVSSTINQWP